MKRIIALSHGLIVAGFMGANAWAAVLTWNGSTSSAWNNATNWLPPQIPTAADTVLFNAGTLTATTNTAFTVMNWTGGSLSGALTVASGSTLYLGGSVLNLYGALTNAGTVVVTNTGYLRLVYSPPNYYGAIYNEPGAVFDIRDDQFYLANDYGDEFFDNAGTLRKSAGTGIARIYPQLINNAGTVDAESGTISFNGGGLVAGQYNAAGSATVSFDSGSYTNSGSVQLTGAGAFLFNGTTLSLPNNAIPGLQLLGGTLFLGPAFQGGSITNLSLAGMTLQSTNTVTGTMTWTAGIVASGLTVASGGTLYVGGSALNLYGALTNAGTVVVTNTGYLRLVYSPPNYYGAIYNEPGAVFDIRDDQFYLANDYGDEFFDNAGTLRKSAGTGIARIYPQLINNAGTVDAESGIISFNGGGLVAGQYNAAGSATVSFDSGSYTNSGSVQLTGAGAFLFNGTTLSLPNNAIPGLQLLGGTLFLGPAFQGGSITNLSLAGMTLQSTNTVTGTMTWTAGIVASGLTVASGGTLYVGGSALNLYGALTNAGTVVVTNTGYLRLVYSPPNYYGAIYNEPGAVFDIRDDQFYLANDYGDEFFDNAGTLRKSAGTGITRIYPQLINNAGTVDAESGSISFNGGGLVAGQYNAAGSATVSFDSGSYTNSGSVQLTGAGAFLFNGTTLSLPNNAIPGLQLLGGTLFLGPAFQGGSITNLSLAGMTLQSTNTVTGTMTWTAGIVASGLTVASGGTLYVGGSALNLYGALTNAGTVVVTNTGYLRLVYSPPNYYGAIYNEPGAVFDIRDDQFYLANDYGDEFFDNAGTLRKSAGTGITRVYVLVNNAGGLIEADAGTISLQTIPNLVGGEIRFGLSSPTNFGMVSIAENAALNGTVGVSLLGGYVPATNTSYTVLTYGSHAGIFTNVDLPATVVWATNYTATAFSLTAVKVNPIAFITAKGQWTTTGFLLTLSGNNDLGPTVIYATTNLLFPWKPIFTNPPVAGTIEFLDSNATNYRARFYNTVEQ